MKHSSRKDPCPICDRNTDDKCRWNDFNIFCYCGESFHPPNSLRLGDSVQAFGKRWKLVKLNGGFSGGSYIFATAADDEPVRRQTKEEREQYRKRIDLTVYKSKKMFSQLRQKVHQCYALRDFYALSLDQIQDASSLLQTTVSDCDAALKFVSRNRGLIPDSKRLTAAYLIWQKRIRYQKKDLDFFTKDCLGILQ